MPTAAGQLASSPVTKGEVPRRQFHGCPEMQDQFGGITHIFRAVRDMQDLYGGIARQVETIKAVQASKGLYADIGEQVRLVTATKDQPGGVAHQVKAITEAQAAKGLYADIGEQVKFATGIRERYEGMAKMMGSLAPSVQAMAALQATHTKMAPVLAELRSIAAMSEVARNSHARRPLAAKGYWPADASSTLLGASGVLDAAKLTLALPPLAREWVERQERDEQMSSAVEAFAKRWEGHALWFIFSALSVPQVYRLARLGRREEVEAVLLDALEAIVIKGVFTAELSAALRNVPSFVSADQRDDMRHGLEHAQRGEFSHAVPPLMLGLEGAFWSAGREHQVIDSERRLLAKPEKGVMRRVEPVVRGLLPEKQEFRTFVCSRIFGNVVGNPVRRGEQHDRRRQALFAVVGIAGWIDAFMGLRARQALARLLHEELASRT
jgi:hypothetical protein